MKGNILGKKRLEVLCSMVHPNLAMDVPYEVLIAVVYLGALAKSMLS